MTDRNKRTGAACACGMILLVGASFCTQCRKSTDPEQDTVRCWNRNDQNDADHWYRAGCGENLWASKKEQKRGPKGKGGRGGGRGGSSGSGSGGGSGGGGGSSRWSAKDSTGGSRESRENAWERNDTCPYCNAAVEDAHHVYCECERWSHIRSTFLDHTRPGEFNNLHPCALSCGVWLQDPRIRQAHQRQIREDAVDLPAPGR